MSDHGEAMQHTAERHSVAHPPKTRISQEQLISAMERLDLRDGDVLVVHDPDLTPRLTALRVRSIDFPLPVIVAKEGNLTKINVEDLRKIVQEYDARNRTEPATAGDQSASPTEGW